MAKLSYGVNPTSIVLRVKLMDSTATTGAGKTGLSSSSSGLIISTIQIGEATAVTYTQAGSTIETISTLGTYAAPTATKCRFKEVDATNHPGIYEVQLADARFNGTGILLVSISGVTGLAQADFEIECSNRAANLIQIAGAAVSATTAQLGVNVVNAAGTAWASGAITDAVFGNDTYPKAIRTNTVNAAAAGYVDLDGSSSSTDNFYVGDSIKITSGPGAGQSRTIVMYTGSTKRAYIDRAWATNPTGASTFLINAGKLTLDVGNVGLAAAGAATTITLAASASTVNDYYDGQRIFIISGTGVGQGRIISGYVGGTKVATVTDGWATTPDTTSLYAIMSLGDVEVGVNNDKTGYSVTGTVAANVTQIDGQATNGNNATLNLKQLNIVNSAGDAIVATAGSNGRGAVITGNGTGAGMSLYSGSNALGLLIQGTGAGAGVAIAGGSTASAVEITAASPGGGSGVKILAYGGHALECIGGANGGVTAGAGIKASALGADDGILVTSVSGHGIHATSGGTNKSGMSLLKGTGTGHDLNFETPDCTVPVVSAANSTSINSSAPAAVQLAKSAVTIVSATVNIVDFAPTTTEFETADLTNPAADFYKSRTVIFTTGTLTNQAREITASSYDVGTAKTHITVKVLTAAPASGVGFNIV